MFIKVKFERIDASKSELNSKFIQSNNYKVFAGSNRVLDVKSNECQSIYEDKAIQAMLIKDVNSMASAYKFTDNLSVTIVLHNKFMRMSGIQLDMIKRENLTKMPYYVVLKVHAGYDNLNCHITKLINKYLTKKNRYSNSS